MLEDIRIDKFYKIGEEFGYQGQWERAAGCFRAITVIDPEYAPAWSELALIYFTMGNSRDALYPIRRALALQPNDQEILKNAILIGLDLGRFPETLEWIESLKNTQPDAPEPDVFHAKLLELTGNFAEAAQALDSAENKGADTREIALKRCELLKIQGKNEDLKVTLQSLLSMYPDSPEAELMLAECQISQENYETGWINYESRLRLPGRPILRNYPWPHWKGEPLHDKSLLLYSEQGAGDIIMFMSCYPDAHKLAHKVSLVCDGHLAKLMEYSFPGLEVMAFSEVPQVAEHNLQAFDYCVAIGSLPLRFRHSAGQFPTHNGYLQANKAWIQPWNEKLQTLGNGLKVGIAWQGGLMRTDQLARSLELEQLMPLLKLPYIQFINIQHGKVRRELKWLAEKHNLPVSSWPLDTKNMTELAGLVSALDLIITPCCSLVHLAGALGKPVWVMTPKVAAWRYLNEGETMPWYPSARLFRQPEAGDWSSVIESIRQQLLLQSRN